MVFVIFDVGRSFGVVHRIDFADAIFLEEKWVIALIAIFESCLKTG